MTVENLVLNVTTNSDEAAKKVSSLAAALEHLQTAANSAQSASAPVANTVKNTSQSARQAGNAMTGYAKGISNVAAAANRSTKPLGNFIASLKRIAYYRFIRSIIKAITQAFSEGLKNAYNFSKGISGTLAVALDGLATKSQTMKNQLGAAFGNLLQVIMPIVMKIVELVRQVAQAISALFSAIGGGDYLVAVDVAKSWDRATGAAKQYKNTVLGFDELNKLDAPGGGGGGSSVDASKMFEKRDLPEWAQKISEHLEIIKDLATAIGIAFAAWNLAKVVSTIGHLNLSMKQLAGIAMTVGGAFLMIDGFIDALKNGVTFDNLVEMLEGVSLATIGLALAFGGLAAGIGLLVGGVVLLISAFSDWIRTGELSTEAFFALEAGILAVGGGLALILGGWIPLVIAAVAALAVAVVKYWDQIKAWTIKTWNNIKDWVVGVWESIKDTAVTIFESVRDKIVDVWTNIKLFFTETIPQLVENIKNWFGELPYKIGFVIGELFGKFVNFGIEAKNWATEKIPEIVASIASFFFGLPSKIWEMLVSVNDKFNEWKTEILSWVVQKIPEIVDKIVGFFETIPEALFNVGKNLIDSLWEGIQSAWGWVSDKVSNIANTVTNAFTNFGKGVKTGYNSVGVSTFASGGFPSMGSVFIAGEAGAEFVGNIGGRTGVVNTDQMAGAVAAGNANVVGAVYAMADAIVAAINNKDMDIEMDGESVARILYRPMQTESNRRGGSLVVGGAY